MKTEKKILKLFIGNKRPKTIREMSKEISADYRIIHTASKRLISKKIILANKVGKSLLCELNPNYYGIEIYGAEDERKENLLKNKDIKQLFREVISKIKSSFFIFLIFGSHAKNRQTRSSDIDMIFISNDKNFEERILSILSLIPIKTHALVFTEEEFIRMKDSKKPNVVKEAIENNIILYGTENYYRLKNA
jgi:predicted nucleotidyltransferase